MARETIAEGKKEFPTINMEDLAIILLARLLGGEEKGGLLTLGF